VSTRRTLFALFVACAFLPLCQSCREERSTFVNSPTKETEMVVVFPATIPDAFGLRIVSFSEESVSLTWYDSDTATSAYVVECKYGDSSQFVPVTSLPRTITSFTDEQMKRILFRYTYRIAATRGPNLTAYSYPIVFYLNPRRPLSVRSIHLSPSSVMLQWNFTGNISRGFLIQRSLDGVTYTSIGTTSTEELSYVDTGLDTTRGYFYRAFTLTRYEMGPSSVPMKIGYVFNPMYQEPQWMMLTQN
jgi:hypothetical protein